MTYPFKAELGGSTEMNNPKRAPSTNHAQKERLKKRDDDVFDFLKTPSVIASVRYIEWLQNQITSVSKSRWHPPDEWMRRKRSVSEEQMPPRDVTFISSGAGNDMEKPLDRVIQINTRKVAFCPMSSARSVWTNLPVNTMVSIPVTGINHIRYFGKATFEKISFETLLLSLDAADQQRNLIYCHEFCYPMKDLFEE
ncbi:hypothetical protein TNCV_849281 [Trichonephila clavipes]|uniref:Uncharacterized protein n=1 Tax=Trichonephila clavipes TaxID=2585209 RepID=A0A8X6V146_TRICX|nr:hypothetical protein TNCV_849281 [Trichonephila clavipes]